MIEYSVQITISKIIEKEWLDYMLNKHINDVMSTGFFLSYKILKKVDDDYAEKSEYSIRYLCSSKEKFDEYITKDAKRLQSEHIEKFGEHFTAKRNLFEII